MLLKNSKPFVVSSNNINQTSLINSKNPLMSGLVAWYLCLPSKAGSVKWYDIVGANHGTLTSMATGASGFRGSTRRGAFGAVQFDGVDDAINVTFPALSIYTLCCWVKRSVVPEATIQSWFCAADSIGDAGMEFGNNGGGGSNSAFISLGRSGDYNPVGISRTAITVGIWYHVAVTMDAGLNVIYYLNGKSDSGIFSYAGKNVTLQTAGAFGRNSNLRNFGGQLDDCRIYNRALMAREISQVYQNSIQGYPNLINRTTKKINIGNNNIVNYPNGPNTSQPSIINNLRQTQLINQRNPLNKGLIAWWLCLPNKIGGPKWLDLLNQNHGTLSGVAQATTGFKSNMRQGGFGYIQLDGSATYVEIADKASLNLTHVGSLSIWAKPLSTTGGVVFAKGNIWNDINCFGIISNASRWQVELNNTGSANHTQFPDGWAVGKWAHIGMVWDGLNLYLYVNGNQIASTPQSVDPTAAGLPIRIGANASGTASNFFNGLVDDARIWNRPLTAQEIKQIYLDSLLGYQKTLNRVVEKRNFPFYISSNSGVKGIDVRQTSKAIIFRNFFIDSGNPASSGTTTISIFELQSDGSLRNYDFSTNAFIVGTPVKSTDNMKHQTINNATTATGIWTYAINQLSAFTVGSIYISQVSNSVTGGIPQTREFQFGNAQGDDGAFTEFVVGLGSSTTSITTNRTDATSFWVGSVIGFTSGACKGLSAHVSAFSNGTFTVSSALPVAPSRNDTGLIFGF